MSLITQFESSGTSFPQKAIEDCIVDALNDQAEIQSVLQAKPTAPSGTGSWEPEIDSLRVVEIICAIEEQLGVTLPSSFIPRGGYASKEDCIADLVAQAKGVWSASVAQEAAHA